MGLCYILCLYLLEVTYLHSIYCSKCTLTHREQGQALSLSLFFCHGSVHFGRVCVEMEGCCGSGFDWRLGPRDFLCCFSQRNQDRWREKKRRCEKDTRKEEEERDEGTRENVKYSDVIALRLSGRAIMDLHRPAASSLSGYDMMAEF